MQHITGGSGFEKFEKELLPNNAFLSYYPGLAMLDLGCNMAALQA